jgi:hypothetical protein
MNDSIAEVRELREMRQNIRQCVDALEECWACQRVCECVLELIDNRSVWLCGECRKRLGASGAGKRRPSYVIAGHSVRGPKG